MSILEADKIKLKADGKSILLSFDGDSKIFSLLTNDWFTPEFWQQDDAVIGQSKGRHITWFVQPSSDISEQSWVLRHYYRGGMVSKITRDLFVFTGLTNTRPYRELRLLNWMIESQLPVPKPIAARIDRIGLFYRADLLMEKIGGKDLVAHLTKQELNEVQWSKIGVLIAKFHLAGIYHADLNAHNIMLNDTDKFWLIDFDRCERRVIKDIWRMQNIERLKRSFLKEKQQLSNFYFDKNCWNYLLNGYHSKMEKP